MGSIYVLELSLLQYRDQEGDRTRFDPGSKKRR